MVARTVEFLKEEQIGNICLFADADGELSPATCIGVYLSLSSTAATSM